jgi:hypothetical protein
LGHAQIDVGKPRWAHPTASQASRHKTAKPHKCVSVLRRHTTGWRIASGDGPPIYRRHWCIARQSSWQARVNQDGKGSRGIRIMPLMIVAGKLSFPSV